MAMPTHAEVAGAHMDSLQDFRSGLVFPDPRPDAWIVIGDIEGETRLVQPSTGIMVIYNCKGDAHWLERRTPEMGWQDEGQTLGYVRSEEEGETTLLAMARALGAVDVRESDR